MTLNEQIKALRKYRIFKMAIFDWVCTIIAAYILTLAINKCQMNLYLFLTVLILLLGAAALLHIVFKQKTMLNYYLGLGDKPDIVIE